MKVVELERKWRPGQKKRRTLKACPRCGKTKSKWKRNVCSACKQIEEFIEKMGKWQ